MIICSSATKETLNPTSVNFVNTAESGLKFGFERTSAVMTHPSPGNRVSLEVYRAHYVSIVLFISLLLLILIFSMGCCAVLHYCSSEEPPGRTVMSHLMENERCYVGV